MCKIVSGAPPRRQTSSSGHKVSSRRTPVVPDIRECCSGPLVDWRRKLRLESSGQKKDRSAEPVDTGKQRKAESTCCFQTNVDFRAEAQAAKHFYPVEVTTGREKSEMLSRQESVDEPARPASLALISIVGAGFGLAIDRRAIMAHSGLIAAENAADGGLLVEARTIAVFGQV